MLFQNKIYREKVQRKRAFAIVITILLLLLFAFFFLFFNNNKNILIYNYEDEFRIEWVVSVDDHYPAYTHVVDYGGLTFPLKSNLINLNDFDWKNIEVIWNIEYSLSENKDVLAVERVRNYDDWMLIYNNTYLLNNALLLFDFSEDSELKATKTWNVIWIAFDDSNLITIEPFVCSKVVEWMDCEQMENDMVANGADYFDSANSDRYYNYTWDTWMLFNDRSFGYKIEFTTLDNLLNISHVIHVIDWQYVFENNFEEIKNNCDLQDTLENYYNNIVLKKISDNLVQLEFSYWFWDVEQNGKVILDILNSWNIDSCSVS